MTKLPKICLTVSVTAFAIGFVVSFSRIQTPPAWTVAMPIGAIFLGLFLVALALQKEVARFDEEERSRLELAKRNAALVAGAKPAKRTDSAARGDATFAAAHSH